MPVVRIISGIYGGRLIGTPRGHATHPMGDRERTALFNSIQGHIAGARVLDAFAGSGALGLEALSRGAEFATFVERDRAACQVITANIALLQAESISKLFKIPLSKFLAISSNKFDIILADPPYNSVNYGLISALVPLLAADGILVLSHPAKDVSPALPGTKLLNTKTYAAAQLSIYSL